MTFLHVFLTLTDLLTLLCIVKAVKLYFKSKRKKGGSCVSLQRFTACVFAWF